MTDKPFVGSLKAKIASRTKTQIEKIEEVTADAVVSVFNEQWSRFEAELLQYENTDIDYFFSFMCNRVSLYCDPALVQEVLEKIALLYDKSPTDMYSSREKPLSTAPSRKRIRDTRLKKTTEFPSSGCHIPRIHILSNGVRLPDSTILKALSLSSL